MHDTAPFPAPQAAGLDPLNLGALVSYYGNLEAANFSAFNDCNAANEQIAAIQKQIRALQVDWD